MSFYERRGKRACDLVLSTMLVFTFWWVLAAIAVLVRIKLGSPVLFRQPRPGLDERIFGLYKFRTMSEERGPDGELLPDDVRLTSFGRLLRATSLDELPEVINILRGDMSIIGPRPQLVRDMVFMTPEERRRHTVRPGLSGLAQISGRNAISWENKFAYDLEYIQNVTFLGDASIFLRTIGKAFLRQEGVTEEGMATASDLGDFLLWSGRISQEEYERGMAEARALLEAWS